MKINKIIFYEKPFNKPNLSFMLIVSFSFFLIAFVVIGLLSSVKSTNTTEDYLLAEQKIPAWLVAISAKATGASGFMFIGLIGFTYFAGLYTIWLIIGWVVGDLVSSLFIHKKMHLIAKRQSLLSFGEILSRWQPNTDYKKLRVLTGIITIIFLGTSAAAQFTAGSKALHVLLGWDYSTGAIVGSIIVLAYCLAGGIRASIWTDAAQGVVMFVSMGLLLVMAIVETGGVFNFITQLESISPTYMNLFPDSLALSGLFGFSLFLLGWLLCGVGIIGQPYVMARFLTLDKLENFNQVRVYYYTFYILFGLLSVAVGLAARLLIPEIGAFDSELALPTMAAKMMPDILQGLILAGIFAATMSTADAQILSCSAALARDILPEKSNSYFVVKLHTFFVTLVALLIALFANSNVFNLVLSAFSALGGAFAPLLILYAMERKVTEKIAIVMVLSGMLTTIFWKTMGLSVYIYEIAPGMLIGFIVFCFLERFYSKKEVSA